MIQQGMCTAFKVAALAGKTYRIALYLGGNLNTTLTAYTTANEVIAPGYTAGGQLLAISTPATSTGSTAYIGFDNVSWTANIVADSALIYVVGSNLAVAVLDFGGVKQSVAGVFTIQFPTADASNAIIRIE